MRLPLESKRLRAVRQAKPGQKEMAQGTRSWGVQLPNPNALGAGYRLSGVISGQKPVVIFDVPPNQLTGLI